MAKKKVEETKQELAQEIKKVKFQFKTNVRYGKDNEIKEFRYDNIYEIEKELAEEFLKESVGIIIE